MSNVFRKVSLERLASPEQLDLLMRVVKPRSWIALASIFMLLVVGVLWCMMVTIPTSISTSVILSENTEITTIYLSSGEIAEISVGMPVNIELMSVSSTGNPNKITGRIASIQQSPVTFDKIASQLVDPALATLLTEDSISFATEIRLDKNPEHIQPGMIGTATILVGTNRLIDLIIPSQ